MATILKIAARKRLRRLRHRLGSLAAPVSKRATEFFPQSFCTLIERGSIVSL